LRGTHTISCAPPKLSPTLHRWRSGPLRGRLDLNGEMNTNVDLAALDAEIDASSVP
jgi:hypothetical protein